MFDYSSGREGALFHLEKVHAYSQNLQMPGMFSLPGEESTSKSDKGSLVSGDLASDAKKGMSLYLSTFSFFFSEICDTSFNQVIFGDSESGKRKSVNFL